jgi:hypothetical protein
VKPESPSSAKTTTKTTTTLAMADELHSLLQRRRRRRRRRRIDLFFASFFISHVFVTLLIDAQVLFPSPGFPFPAPLRDLLRSYVRFSGDYLVRDRPAFFLGLVLAELLFQLPLTLANSFAFLYGKHPKTKELPLSRFSASLSETF